MTGDDHRQPVSVARVFEYAVEQIIAVAGELWPGEPVQQQRLDAADRKLRTRYATVHKRLSTLHHEEITQ